MDALSFLKKDHAKVKELLETLSKTTSRAVRTRLLLLEEVSNLLKLHEDIEETLFYPSIKEKSKTRELTLEAYQEHHIVDLDLKEIVKLDPKSDEWKAKLTVLKEHVEHHVHEEEDVLFPKVKEVFDKTILESMGEKMEKMKEENLSPHQIV